MFADSRGQKMYDSNDYSGLLPLQSQNAVNVENIKFPNSHHHRSDTDGTTMLIIFQHAIRSLLTADAHPRAHFSKRVQSWPARLRRPVAQSNGLTPTL